ncbi:MAG: MFS transporter [Alphaproteobacteria bacterium]|nr:MFS transporter [Alphaproteobacteria bacterium]
MTSAERIGADKIGAGNRAIAAWCLYDFANSGYVTVVVTFVFATYFAQAVAPNPETGTAWWGTAQAMSAILIALASPIFGAIADQTGPRKPWILAFALATVFATAALWGVTPDPSAALFALVMVVIANVGFEVAQVFYNAMLPRVAGTAALGRVSGWAWGVGYLGGLLCLVVALFGFVQADPPPFGLDAAVAEPVRATSLLVAVWVAVFAIPLFLWVPDDAGRGLLWSVAAGQGLAALWRTLKTARAQPNLMRFLIARMIYNDGINTLFAFGGIYAAGTFGMTIAEVIQLGIALNVTAGLGAAGFGWLDDKIGSRRTVVFSLVAIMILGTVVLLAPDRTTFWISTLALSTFFGPVQASSRTLMARLAPVSQRNEMFGLFAVTGKAISFLGPLTVGWITLATGSQRWGLATLMVFFAVGLWLLRSVRDSVPEVPHSS